MYKHLAVRGILSRGAVWSGLCFRVLRPPAGLIMEAGRLLRRLLHPGERRWGQWGGKGGMNAFKKSYLDVGPTGLSNWLTLSGFQGRRKV